MFDAFYMLSHASQHLFRRNIHFGFWSKSIRMWSNYWSCLTGECLTDLICVYESLVKGGPSPPGIPPKSNAYAFIEFWILSGESGRGGSLAMGVCIKRRVGIALAQEPSSCWLLFGLDVFGTTNLGCYRICVIFVVPIDIVSVKLRVISHITCGVAQYYCLVWCSLG